MKPKSWTGLILGKLLMLLGILGLIASSQPFGLIPLLIGAGLAR